MKTAIGSTTNDISGEISEKGGRSPFYLIFDDSNELLEVIKNPFAVGGGGAGFGVAKMLSDIDVKKIVVGKAGGNMRSAVEAAGIELVEKEGLLKDELN